MKQTILLLALVMFFPIMTYALDISTKSGPMSAEIVINPDPIIAGEKSVIWLKFSDTRKLFTLKRCDCYIKISEEKGTDVINYRIEQDKDYIEEFVKEFAIVFPDIGNYKITISGISTNKVFEPFELTEKITVSNKHKTEAEKRWESFKDKIVSYIIPFIIILLAMTFGFRFILK